MNCTRHSGSRTVFAPAARFILLLALLIAGAGCRTLTRDGSPSVPEGEYLKPAFDGRTWILTNRKATANSSLTEYLPEGQSPLRWQESLGITFQNRQTSLQSEYESFVASLRSGCRVVAARVRKSNDTELFYEWRANQCYRQPDQTEVGRFIKSPRGIYRIAYVRKGAALTDRDLEKWLALLEKAELRNTD